MSTIWNFLDGQVRDEHPDDSPTIEPDAPGTILPAEIQDFILRAQVTPPAARPLVDLHGTIPNCYRAGTERRLAFACRQEVAVGIHCPLRSTCKESR
jgi:hypothetical protein